MNGDVVGMVIIDLYSQRAAVAAQLRRVESGGKLEWLRERGDLTEVPMPEFSPPTYLFRSRQGIQTGFFIRDGKMFFLVDSTTAGAIEIGA